MKICNKCCTNKELSEFYKRRHYKDGIESICKDCRKKASRIRRTTLDKSEENKKARELYYKHHEKHKEYCRTYYSKNKEQEKNKSAKYKQDNKEKNNKYVSHYRQKNIIEINGVRYYRNASLPVIGDLIDLRNIKNEIKKGIK